MDAKERKQELESPIWAVIASDGVIATELTYSAAAKLVHDLQLVRQGITIVTQAVADKLKEQIASK